MVSLWLWGEKMEAAGEERRKEGKGVCLGIGILDLEWFFPLWIAFGWGLRV